MDLILYLPTYLSVYLSIYLSNTLSLPLSLYIYIYIYIYNAHRTFNVRYIYIYIYMYIRSFRSFGAQCHGRTQPIGLHLIKFKSLAQKSG